MKKRLWILVLPVLLCSAVVWAKQAAWNRMEEDFRRTFVQEAILTRGQSSVGLSRGLSEGNPISLGQWKGGELAAALADVHLMHSPPPPQFSESVPEYFICYNSEMSNYYGIFLGVSKDKGTFCFELPRNDQIWHGLELTPESCHALKRRILSHQKLAAK